MRIGAVLLAMVLVLGLMLVLIVTVSGLDVEEAVVPGQLYELRRGADGAVYASNAGLSEVWHIESSGAYTVYQGVLDVYDAQPDASGDIWFTDGYLTFGRIDVASDTKETWWAGGAENLGGLAFDASGRVWLTQYFGTEIYRFDPETTEVCSYTVGAPSDYVVYGAGSIWLANWFSDRIYQVDIGADTVAWWPIPGGSPRPMGLAVDEAGRLWWADKGLQALVRLEPAADQITAYSLPLGSDPKQVEVTPEGVWYTEYTSGVGGTFGLLRPDQATGTPTDVTGAPPAPLVAEGCAVLGSGSQEPVATRSGSLAWTADTFAAVVDADGWTVYEMPSGPVNYGPYGIAASGGTVWIGDQGRQKLVRFQPPLAPEPAIDLEKWTNGQDADDPPGRSIVVGQPVTWTYAVTNTGNVDLTDVTVTDDNGTPANPADDYVCTIGTLEAGATDDTTCFQEGTAAEGSFANVAIAVGVYNGSQVEDVDASHYTGVVDKTYIFLPLILR